MKTKLITYLLFIAPWCAYAQTKTNVPSTIAGKWDVWIPGAVTYVKKESDVYQVYELGSAMSQLQILADGSYQWGNSKSKLSEVRPWYAEENKRYYRIRDLKNNVYDFWYKESSDELILLFGEVGGHAATGSRIGDKVAGKKTVEDSISVTGQQSHEKLSNQKADFKFKGDSVHFTVKEKVLVLWSGSWYKAEILDYKIPKYLVRYEGWGSLYDEWVSIDRIKKEE